MNIYEWLEGIGQPDYGPTSPPFMASPEPMDEDIFAGIPMDDMPHSWNVSFQQSQTDGGTIPLDPSLHMMTGPPAPTTSSRTTVTVPEHLAKASSRILIYLAQTLEIPGSAKDWNEEPVEETAFTAEELEALEPVTEDDFESSAPSTINGICVNANPQAAEIEYIIDLRRIRPSRLTFYLAKTIKGNYYWFHSPQADRDRSLRKLIGEFRHESQGKTINTKTSDVRKLRSGRTIGM